MNPISFLDIFHLFTSGSSAPAPGSTAANLQVLLAGLAVAQAFGLNMGTMGNLKPEQLAAVQVLLTAIGIQGVNITPPPAPKS